MIYNFFYILLKGGTFIINITIATIITNIPIVNATLFLNFFIIYLNNFIIKIYK